MKRFAITADYFWIDSSIKIKGALLICKDSIESYLEEASLGSPQAFQERCNQENRQIISRPGCAVFPGLFNLHSHAPMALFRGIADDLPLQEWLHKHIWPAESKHLSQEFCHDGALLAACEMALAGTIYANDMYFHCEAIGEAFAKVGMRATVGQTIFDFPTVVAASPAEYFAATRNLAAHFRGHELIKAAIAPHAPYTVSPENLRKSRQIADELAIAINIHAAETKWEDEEIRKKYGKSPLAILAESGVLGDDCLLAHCVHLSAQDIDLIVTSRSGVAHNISSNLKLASGIAPIPKMLNAGVRLGFGTDGAASNNSLSTLSEMAIAAKVHKGVTGDPTVLAATQVIDMATKHSAQINQRDDLGELKPKNKADLFIVALDHISTTPTYDPASHLIYTATSDRISDVMVNGSLIVEHGRTVFVDSDEVREKAAWWGKKIKDSLC